MKISLLFTILNSFSSIIECARILGVFPTPSVSHQVVYRAIFKELHDRGHDLTIITTDPIKINSTRYEQIDLGPISYSEWRKRFDFAEQFGESQPTVYKAIRIFLKTFEELFEIQIKQKEMQQFLKQDRSYDLVIFEWLLTPGFYSFACKYSAPYIGVSSLSVLINGHDSVGNPSHPGYLPELLLEHLDTMDYYNRVRSFLYYFWFKYFYYYDYLPKIDKISQKYVQSGCPYVGDIETNVSLVLTNTNPILSFPRPNLPAMIEFGGPPLHMPIMKPLSSDLKAFLDNATDGVIYMSLGSNVKSSTMTEHKRKQFLDAFKNRKEKILWKWETETLPGKPDNVKLGKWFPQSDLLGHTNIKAFITQGGLQSMGEATHYTVPLVVVPIFGDQKLNAKKLVSMGVAVSLDFETLTSEELSEALDQVIYSKSYKENMIKYRELTRDQPQAPIDKAVWWIEYVIRHRGASHLRSAVVDMPMYQYLMLDVLLLVLGLPIFIVYLISKLIICLCKSRSSKVKKE